MFDSRGPTLGELARLALSSTTRGYDLLAPKFEYTPFRTPDAVLVELAKQVGPDDSIDRALDLGCGTGAAMVHLRPKCRQEVVGVDLSVGMLREAKKQVEAAKGAADIRLVKADFLDIDFAGEFDVITSVGAFGHVLRDQQDAFARLVFQALRPGGRFLFVTTEMPPVLSRAWLGSRLSNGAMHVRNALLKPEFIMFYLTFTLERAREVLGAAGFKIEVQRPFLDGPFQRFLMVEAKRSC